MARDHADAPPTPNLGTALSIKWVPLQPETGWSLGLRLHHQRSDTSVLFDQGPLVARQSGVTGLASYNAHNGAALHLNAGVAHALTMQDERLMGTWGIGGDWPLSSKTQLVAEVFGRSEANPDKAIGLRYLLSKDISLAAAIGHGNGRAFGRVVWDWEF